MMDPNGVPFNSRFCMWLPYFKLKSLGHLSPIFHQCKPSLGIYLFFFFLFHFFPLLIYLHYENPSAFTTSQRRSRQDGLHAGRPAMRSMCVKLSQLVQ